jgi:hypothetical protein
MDNSSKLKKMKNENNKFMPFLIILVPLVLMKLTLMIMKKNPKVQNNNTNLFSKKEK